MIGVAFVLTNPKLEENYDQYELGRSHSSQTWEKGSKFWKHEILNVMIGTLYDVYSKLKTATRIWNGLIRKYIVENVRTKKMHS